MVVGSHESCFPSPSRGSPPSKCRWQKPVPGRDVSPSAAGGPGPSLRGSPSERPTREVKRASSITNLEKTPSLPRNLATYFALPETNPNPPLTIPRFKRKPITVTSWNVVLELRRFTHRSRCFEQAGVIQVPLSETRRLAEADDCYSHGRPSVFAA